jgi:hypothetical protein
LFNFVRAVRPGKREFVFMPTVLNEIPTHPAPQEPTNPCHPEPLPDWLVQRSRKIGEATNGSPIYVFHVPDAGHIAEVLGFSPLIDPKTGDAYPDRRFRPFWTVKEHEGWFEMTVCFGAPDLAFTFVLFIKDCDSGDPALRAACREFAGVREPWKSETLNGAPAGEGAHDR